MARAETKRERRAFIGILIAAMLVPAACVGLWLLGFFMSCDAEARIKVGMTRGAVLQELRWFRESDSSWAAATSMRIWFPSEARARDSQIRSYSLVGLMAKPIFVGYDNKGRLAAIQEYE